MIIVKHKKWWHRFIPGRRNTLKIIQAYLNDTKTEDMVMEAMKDMILYGHADIEAITKKYANKQ